jgi:hypothetical protein
MYIQEMLQRKLGILTRKQNDGKALDEISKLRELDQMIQLNMISLYLV